MWKGGLMLEPLLISLLHSAKAQECSAFPPQTLPELCSRQDELDFLMEALIIRCTPGQAGGCGGRQDVLQEWPLCSLGLRGSILGHRGSLHFNWI